jgi:hypothetical protein
MLKKKIAPLLINQRTIGLKRVTNGYPLLIPLFLQSKRLPIEINREYHRLACVPNAGDTIRDKGRHKKILEYPFYRLHADPLIQGPLWQITIATINVA